MIVLVFRAVTLFLSTPSARRATYTPFLYLFNLVSISIHALREEGDHAYKDYAKIIAKFLSTPSARRATRERQRGLEPRLHFYPRPPRGGRPRWQGRIDWDKVFLSTPSARRATVYRAVGALQHRFLSTPSARRATGLDRQQMTAAIISIHALREEGDRCRRQDLREISYFYPRPPRGGRRSRGQSRKRL